MQLLGSGVTTSHYVFQQPFWPTPAATRTLRFYLKIVTAETTTTAANDTLAVRIFNASNVYVADLAVFSNLNAGAYGSYALVTVTVPASLAGSNNRIRFVANENASLQTTFLVDDVVLY
jgi:hypothetical protein